MPVLDQREDLPPAEALAALQALAGAFLETRHHSAPGTSDRTMREPERQSPAAMLRVDDDDVIRGCDARAEQMWGRPASEIVERSLAELVEPLPPRTGDIIRAITKGGEAEISVFLTRHTLNGNDPVSVVSVRPGDTLGDGGPQTDLRYRNLVEQIPAVVFTAALDGGLSDIYVGPQIQALLGYSQEEWLRSPVLWYERLHPDDRRLLDREFARGCATGGPFRAECRFVAVDGRIVWVHGEARLIKDARGLPLFLQGVAFDITETKRAEQVVRASLQEKELLLKEIHHRVKNNLQITSSLLRLQVAKVPEEGARQTLRESQNRIRSIALVHEMLYRSPDLSRVNFADYVKALLLQLFRSYNRGDGRIAQQVEIDDIALGIDIAVPCGLILNELVANALKHAFPAGRTGIIRVTMRRQGDHCHLIVGDNGIGLPMDFDISRSESLGLQLVRTLTDQLDGKLHLQRDNGTEVSISFPIGGGR